jgi:hypothetical protein
MEDFADRASLQACARLKLQLTHALPEALETENFADKPTSIDIN